MKIDNLQWRVNLRNALYEGARQEETPQQKRLKEIQESLQRLQEMPSPKTSQKQAAAERVGWLKQRLEALKMMLLHATPEQAKALARELKSIAKELASAAKSLSSGSGSGTTQPTVQGGASAETGAAAGTDEAGQQAEGGAAEAAVRQAEAEAAQAAAGESAGAAAGTAGAGSEAAAAEAGQEASEEASQEPGESQRDDDAMEAAADKSLRQLLAETRKLLKEALELLKAKLRQGDEEARRDAQAAEKSLGDLDDALAQGGDSGFYTAQGDLGGGEAAAGGAEVGANISVSV